MWRFSASAAVVAFVVAVCSVCLRRRAAARADKQAACVGRGGRVGACGDSGRRSRRALWVFASLHVSASDCSVAVVLHQRGLGRRAVAGVRPPRPSAMAAAAGAAPPSPFPWLVGQCAPGVEDKSTRPIGGGEQQIRCMAACRALIKRERERRRCTAGRRRQAAPTLPLPLPLSLLSLSLSSFTLHTHTPSLNHARHQ